MQANCKQKLLDVSLKKKNIFWLSIILVVLCLFYLGTRMYQIDMDLPPWGVTMYQPMDEGQYATMALTEYNNGSFNMSSDDSFYVGEHVRTNVIENIIIYLCMNVFGDNYYGFRMASVIAGFVVMITFFGILLACDHGNNVHNIIKLIFSFLLIANFSYLMSNRVIEPTIYRTMFIQITILTVALGTKNGKNYNAIYIICGFLSVLSVFAVYITNAFVVLSFGLLFVFEMFKKKRGWEHLFSYAFGALIAYFLCELYYYFAWGTSCLGNALVSVQSFGNNTAYAEQINILKALNTFFSSNPFIYNLFILFLFFFCFIPESIRAFKENDTFIIINILLVLCFFVQTIISNDYVTRKAVIIYPQVLLIIYDYYFRRKQAGTRNGFPWVHIELIITTLLVVFIWAYRTIAIDANLVCDYTGADVIVLVSQLLLVIACFAYFLDKGGNLNGSIFGRRYLSLLLVISLYSSCYFAAKYVFINPSFSERRIMENIGSYADEDRVYGVYSISFTLYNNIKPIVNTNKELAKQIETQYSSWYVDYEVDKKILAENPKYDWLDTAKNVEIVDTFQRNFMFFGNNRGITLYKYK